MATKADQYQNLPPPPSAPPPAPPPPLAPLPVPPVSASIPESTPDHWWSRKPKEERRPLGSRLLWNFWEFRHPGKVFLAGLLAVFAVAVIAAAVSALGDDGSGSDTAVIEPDRFAEDEPGDEADELPFTDTLAGATLSGPLDGPAGLSGEVRLELSSTGDEITDFEAEFAFDDYQCPGGPTVNGTMSVKTSVSNAPIVNGSFAFDTADVLVEGQFDSATSASGTLDGTVKFVPSGSGLEEVAGGCDVGFVDWTATVG